MLWLANLIIVLLIIIVLSHGHAQPSHVVPASPQSTSHHHYDPITSLQTLRDILEHGPELSDTPTKHQEGHTALEPKHSLF